MRKLAGSCLSDWEHPAAAASAPLAASAPACPLLCHASCQLINELPTLQDFVQTYFPLHGLDPLKVGRYECAVQIMPW